MKMGDEILSKLLDKSEVLELDEDTLAEHLLFINNVILQYMYFLSNNCLLIGSALVKVMSYSIYSTLITNLSLNSSSGLSFMFKLQLSISYTKINGVTFAINQ